MAKKQMMYAPSWVDRLLDWIDRLPIPSWAFYLIVYLVSVVATHFASWLNLTLPWGQPSVLAFLNGVWPPLVFFIIHNTDNLAEEAMRRFQPLVRTKLSEFQELRYRITTMPAGVPAVLYTLSLLVMGWLSIQDPRMVVYETPPGEIHPLSWVIGFVLSVPSYSMAPIIFYHALRQLYLITKAFELVDEVNVFHQQPMYAFSGLTMRTALWFLSMVYVTYVSNLLYEATLTEDTINLSIAAGLVPASLFVVLVPLLGIHARLVQAKAEVLARNSHQIEKAQLRLYQAIDKNSTEKIKGADAAISSLYRVQEQLRSIPTWPWATGSFRNFLSAILIPMMLWLLQTLASRFL